MHGHDVGSSKALHILEDLAEQQEIKLESFAKLKLHAIEHKIGNIANSKVALLFSHGSISVSSVPAVERSSGTVPDLPGSPAVWRRLSGRGRTLN